MLSLGPVLHAQRVVDQGLVIQNVTLISPERASPLLHASFVIRDGRIAEIATHLVAGPRARRIDGTGQFLIPGLIDSHVHVGHSAALDDDAIDAHPELWAAYRAQVPRAYLAFGFTSVVDLDLAPATKSLLESLPTHPRLYHW
jgi:imidazolonepropionase-like amidohydrolase